MRERDLINRILLAVQTEWPTEVRLFRNSVGMGTVGTPDRATRRRAMRFGLAVGSADLIGIGRDGVFLSLEVKADRRRLTAAQRKWKKMIRDMGGIAHVVSTPEEAVRILHDEFAGRRRWSRSD